MTKAKESGELAFARFRKLVRQVVRVPKSEVNKRAEEQRYAREVRKAAKAK